MPSCCTVSTTGHAATCPYGDRATTAASSRTSGTRSSTISAVPEASSSAASATSPTTQTPLPSYPPRVAFTTTGQPTSAPNRSRSAADSTGAQRGTGAPSAVSRSRMTRLSWACTSASGPGSTFTPSAASARRCSVGTCSWSNVTTSQPSAKRRSASRSVCCPCCTIGGDQGRTVVRIGREHAQ